MVYLDEVSFMISIHFGDGVPISTDRKMIPTVYLDELHLGMGSPYLQIEKWYLRYIWMSYIWGWGPHIYR